MAQRLRTAIDEPLGNQGTAALTSVIGQYKSRIKSLEYTKLNLEKENSALKQRMAQSNPEKGTVSYLQRHDDKEIKSRPRKQVHLNPGATMPSTKDQDAESKLPSRERIINDAFISGIIEEESLPHDKETKRKFMDLISLLGQRLANAEDLKRRQRELEEKLGYARKTIMSLIQLFTLLDNICLTQGCEPSEGLPSWFEPILDRSALSVSPFLLGKMWKLLQWNLHHFHDKKPSILRMGQLDAWYLSHDNPTQIYDIEKQLTDLYEEMCSYSNVMEEEGLSLSILNELEVEDPPASPESEDSSLSSRIPAADLMTLKSIIQSLVEKFEEMRTCSQCGHSSDGGNERDSDLYLPQWDALETYDLGKLIQTMNSVIETLSNKLRTTSSQRKLCVQCQQAIGQEVGPGVYTDQVHQEQGTVPVLQPGTVPVRPSHSLHSNESLPRAPTIPQSHVVPSMYVVAPPQNPPFLPQASTFPGASRPLPPRNLTAVKNSSSLVRSKSDSSPRGRRAEGLPSKPSSLDSVLAPKRTYMYDSNSRSPLTRDFQPRSGGRTPASDSDDDYEIRGPPNTPPEVRVKQLMLVNERRYTKDLDQQGGHIHQKSDDSGLNADLSGQYPTLGDQYEPHILKGAQGMPFSQVQQCTGDTMNTIHDMLLPSSVEWSTVQLKEGGIKDPSPEAMSRYSSSINLAKRTIQRRQCVLCQKEFSASDSEAVIYDHIQGHLSQSSPPDSSLVTLTQVEDPRQEFPASGTIKDERCPVCNKRFSPNTPLQARRTHVDLHFESEDTGFEVVDNYKKT